VGFVFELKVLKAWKWTRLNRERDGRNRLFFRLRASIKVPVTEGEGAKKEHGGIQMADIELKGAQNNRKDQVATTARARKRINRHVTSSGSIRKKRRERSVYKSEWNTIERKKADSLKGGLRNAHIQNTHQERSRSTKKPIRGGLTVPPVSGLRMVLGGKTQLMPRVRRSCPSLVNRSTTK